MIKGLSIAKGILIHLILSIHELEYSLIAETE